MRIAVCCIILLSTHLYSQQSIQQIKLLPSGSVVTTTGTITSGEEWGQIRYMQDANAGIAIYSALLSSTIPGDSIIITGVLSSYRNELQLSPVMSFQIVETGKGIAEVEMQNLLDLSQPQFESRKFILACMGIASCENQLEGGWYVLFDQWGNTSRLWIAEDHVAKGFPITEGAVSVEGIWTKFEDQYQLLCQTISDASEGTCHIVPQGHVSYTSGSTHVIWNLPADNDVAVQFGEHNFSTQFFFVGSSSFVEFDFSSLPPGIIYQTRLLKTNLQGEEFFSIPTYFSIPSPDPSPIEILFNRNVNAAFSDGSHPLATGSSVIETDIINRIDQVSYSLDIAMYNTSRDPIVQAVKRAAQRGVSVRYIADDETSNSALEGTQPFPVLFRSGDGIMHNKFIIGDAGDVEKAWLWTGSTNFSSNQLSSDPNHAYVIHDQVMALNYRREFDEMWGQLTNHSDGRYGDFKTNNTIHQFKVGDALIESYFSPSDETNCHILEALQSADHQVLIGLLLLTKEDLVDEMIALHQSGVEVRVIVEDEASSADALIKLLEEGVPVSIHDFSPIFHHKYAIIDEGFSDSDPQVVTGSHNWTWSADNINDENTLIIHDQSVTNIFRQEYEARWEELNPTSLNSIDDDSIEVYPNPASSYISIGNPFIHSCFVNMMDIYGRVFATFSINPERIFTLNVDPDLPNGMYFLQITLSDQQFSKKVIVIK